MPKVTIIGAGSIGFSRRLMRDLLWVPEFQNDIHYSLHDINERNLHLIADLMKKEIKANGFGAKVTESLDRREALRDADYIICTVRIGGLDALKNHIEIPLKYGIDQAIGDTLCAGGIFYGQIGIAQILEFCRDIREVAKPGAIMLNYANPMAMLTWAANVYGGVNTIGLCHGVQGGARLIAKLFDIPVKELDYSCVGINHQTWYVKIEHKGRDLRSLLLEKLEQSPDVAKFEQCRIDVLRRTGYFSTESNGHLSEYLPWYRKRPDEMERWFDLENPKVGGGETGKGLRLNLERKDWFYTDAPKWLDEEPAKLGETSQTERSHEHGSFIIESLETGRVYRGHFNVMNNGVVPNLPDDCCVEVPGYVDGTGVNIPVQEPLPDVCAAICNASVSVQRMAVKAAVSGDYTLLRHAMLMDPLVSTVCNTDEIWQMTDEMLVAEEPWLPQYGEAIAEAKKRIEALKKEGKPLQGRYPTKGRRLPLRSKEELDKAWGHTSPGGGKDSASVQESVAQATQ